jgi:O-antigen ligase
MIATRLSYDRFFIIVRNVLLGMVVAGLLSWLLGYQKALYIDAHDRYNLLGLTPIRGFFPHKIVAALFANIAIALTLATMRGFAKWCFVSICIVFIILTGSSTGILLLILTFIGFPALSILQGTRVPAYLVMTALLPFVLGTIVLLTGYFDQILELLGRDSSLTGRTDLWQWGINSWLERPLFGWGFKGYFDSEEAFGLHEIDRFRSYDVPHFHQSFIQIAVDLGIPGLSLITLNIIIAIAGCYKRSAYSGERISTGVLVVLLVSLVGSTSMFLFYNYNHPVTVILLYLMFYFTRRTRRGRRVMYPEQSWSPLPHAN